MDNEVELYRRETVLVRGVANSKIGTAILTTERLLFFDEKFSSVGGGGLVADVIVDVLQTRHEAGGPLLDLPLTSITGIAREKKLFNKNRIRISAGSEEFLFNEGWIELGGLLIDTLRNRYGRQPVEVAPDSWRIEAS